MLNVLLAGGAWSLLALALSIIWASLQVRRFVDEAAGAGSGGIGAVSSGIGPLILWLLITFGPPLVLIATWFVLRTR